MLMPEEEFGKQGGANNRALAYLANGGAIVAAPGDTAPGEPGPLHPLFGVGLWGGL